MNFSFLWEQHGLCSLKEIPMSHSIPPCIGQCTKRSENPTLTFMLVEYALQRTSSKNAFNSGICCSTVRSVRPFTGTILRYWLASSFSFLYSFSPLSFTTRSDHGGTLSQSKWPPVKCSRVISICHPLSPSCHERLHFFFAHLCCTARACVGVDF